MVKPLRDNIVLEMSKDYYHEIGSLYLPSKDVERDQRKKQEMREIGQGYMNHIRRGTVVAVGPKVEFVKEGDELSVNRHNGVEFEWDDMRLIAIRECDCEYIVDRK